MIGYYAETDPDPLAPSRLKSFDVAIFPFPFPLQFVFKDLELI